MLRKAVYATCQLLNASAKGKLLGWGTGQGSKAVATTRAAIDKVTPESVKKMMNEGLDKPWVKDQLSMYDDAIKKGGEKLNNTQLEARKELMERVLEHMPDGD
jgi:hypothetical protein